MWANFWLNPTPLWFWLDAKRERLLAAGGIGPLESETLLTEIAGYCRRVGMAESTFGRLAVNDGKLVSRLRFGGRVRGKTVERVRAFMTRQRDVDPAERRLRPIAPAEPTIRHPGPASPP